MNQVKYWLGLVVVGMLLVTGTAHQQSGGAPQVSYVGGELLVKFKGDASSPSHPARAAHGQVGAAIVREFPFTGWQHVRLPDGMSVSEGLDRYRQMPGVLAVQPNYLYRTLATPNDPRFGDLYGMSKIQAPAAWDTTTGNSNVVVAVIDTGVDYTHEDLSANMWRNPGEIPGNGIDDDGNGYVDDVYGVDTINHDSDPQVDSTGGYRDHGTHVAGTIGAVGNNAVGVVGVNWAVKIMAIKSHGGDGNGTSASVTEAFQYVAMMKSRGVNVRVTSNSWGGPPEAAQYDQALKDAIDAAGNAGILNVFAAGNSASNNDAVPFYPASYDSPSIVAVAASDANDNRASFSSFGPMTVDIAAPGVGILSTTLGSTYGTKSGTSMATPHVSGAAALLAGFDGSQSVASLKAALLGSVDVLPQWTDVVASGGRLNLARALQNLKNCTFSLASLSQSFAADGGGSSVNVSVTGGCDWPAIRNAGFLTINSGSMGSGNGAVDYSVAANSNNTPRAGTLTIAGRTFTVLEGAQFADVPADHMFYTFIGKLSARGVTGGCSSDSFCPDSAVTREQMAAFIIKALGDFNPPKPSQPRFADVPQSSLFYNFIDELAARHITSGCGGGNFCPDSPVTRGQMAVFIIKALGDFNPTPPPAPHFGDVPTSHSFYPFIEKLAALGITRGCGNGNFCPESPVTRGQAAVFLVRAFNL